MQSDVEETELHTGSSTKSDKKQRKDLATRGSIAQSKLSSVKEQSTVRPQHIQSVALGAKEITKSKHTPLVDFLDRLFLAEGFSYLIKNIGLRRVLDL